MKRPSLLSALCLATTGLLIALLVYFGWQSWQRSRAPINMRLMVTSWPTARLLYAAQSLGLFEKHGLRVDLVDVGNDESVGLQAIRDGSIDGGALVLTEPLLLTAEGVPMKVVLDLDYSDGADGIVADNSVSGVADLKGKRVAYEENSSGHFLLSEALRGVDLGEKDVVGVERSGHDGVSSFLNYDVDAVVTLEPYLSQAAARDHSHIIFTSRSTPGLLPDVIAFRSEYAATHREQIKSFLDSWLDLIDYLDQSNQQRREVLASAAMKNGASISDVEQQFTGIHLFQFTESAAAFTYGNDISSLYGSAARLINFFVNHGLSARLLNVSYIVDPSYLRGSIY